MPCYHPLQGYAKIGGGITFDYRKSNANKMTISCGHCIGCRLKRSKEWAVRIMHEASLHEENQFLTLTYAPEHLPRSGSLEISHFQKFMKRYRKAVGPLRFFHCGEYGEKLSRPHYHAIIFGHAFTDLTLVRPGLYTSPTLATLWGKGFVTIGDVTTESAAYVARYVVKKQYGKSSDDHYRTIDYETGETVPVRPEYVTMSRNPGIASDWYQKFKGDVHPSDEVILNGIRYPTPRYYDKLLEREYPDDLEKLKARRKETAKKFAHENTPERLATRKLVQQLRIKKLVREYETT